MPSPSSRPTTEAERALVAGASRGQKMAYLGLAGFLVALGLLLSVLVAEEGWGASVGVSALLWGLAGLVWLGYLKLERVTPVEPHVATRVEGEFAVRTVPSGRYKGRRQATIGERAVSAPPPWHGYLSPGADYAVWAVETDRVPLVVAVEGGPSADGDAEIRAAHRDGSGTMAGPLFAAYVLIVQALLVVSWRAASGEMPGWAWALSGALVVGGVVVVVRAGRRRDRLHAGYHAAGVRGARPLQERRARRWRRTAVLSGTAGTASAAAVALLLAFPAPLAVAVGVIVALLGWASTLATEDSLSPLHGAGVGSPVARG